MPSSNPCNDADDNEQLAAGMESVIGLGKIKLIASMFGSLART